MGYIKKMIFSIVFIPACITILAFESFSFFAQFVRAIGEVVQIIFARFEYWAFDVDRTAYFNSPFRKSLKEYFVETFDKTY